MRIIFSLLFLLSDLQVVYGQLGDSTCVHSAEIFSCVSYVRNYDGDTVTFDIPGVHPLFGRNISVRILGIDTPEVKTSDSCEKEQAIITKMFVKDKLQTAKRIDLVNLGRDKYFRILAEIHYDGQSLSQALISQGLAVPYDGGKKSKTDWCKLRRNHLDSDQVPPSTENTDKAF